MNEEKKVTARSYTLRTETGRWLGQIVLTSDGMFAAITDYGSFSFAWRAYGEQNFRQFLVSLGEDYFASKMYEGMVNIAYGKKYQRLCDRFAKMILPPLQKILKEELAQEEIRAKNSIPAIPYNLTL